ncbi:MAG: hypothetical protein FWG34_06720 [Oscillospiraceae bacterium]|nr:hypothetical protein [Oscillospiraceae bacterium]
MKRNNNIYIYAMMFIFLLVLFWCPVMYSFNRLEVISIEDLRNYKDPDKVYEEDEFLADIFNSIEQGKASLHDMYTNYLPFYNQLVEYMQNADRNSQAKFLELMGNKQTESKTEEIAEIAEVTETPGETKEKAPEKEPVKVVAKLLYDDNFHRYYGFEPYKFLDRWIIGDEKSLRKKFDKQVENINRLIDSDLDVNFYVYVLTRMQDTEYAMELVPNEFSTLDFFYEFIYYMNGAKGVGYFDINTVEKRVERVFLTDHHWAAPGAYSGYVDVVEMMKKNTPEIGDPIPLNGETGLIRFDDVEMRGSFAAVLRYEEYYEPFIVLDITLPEYANPGHWDAYEQYSAGKFDKNKYADHYSAYYNSSGQRHYSLKNKTTGRNLLVIGDSYSWWFNWLIAANFDNVYIYLPPWDQKNFQYNQFVRENKITDVLLTQFSDRLMFNYYGDSNFASIRTD